MKYGKDLISRGASTTRTPAMTAVIFANLRGTVRIKSVCAMAKIAGTKNGRVFRVAMSDHASMIVLPSPVGEREEGSDSHKAGSVRVGGCH
jgi:hypothetical protein